MSGSLVAAVIMFSLQPLIACPDAFACMYRELLSRSYTARTTRQPQLSTYRNMRL